MASTPTLADAYRQVREAEVKVIRDFESVRDGFVRDLDAVAAMLPEEAAGSPAGAYLARVRMSVAGVFGFDLANLKQIYGLVEAPAAPPQA